MSKLTYEDKIKIYEEKQAGETWSSLSAKYKVNPSVIQYLVRLIDKHGLDILRTTKNKYYTSYQKETIINRVLLNNESIVSVAIDEGLLSWSMLLNWIKKYKEMG